MALSLFLDSEFLARSGESSLGSTFMLSDEKEDSAPGGVNQSNLDLQEIVRFDFAKVSFL